MTSQQKVCVATLKKPSREDARSIRTGPAGHARPPAEGGQPPAKGAAKAVGEDADLGAANSGHVVMSGY